MKRTCDGCGFDEEENTFIEGWCKDCYNERQQELDLHNAQFDHWESLSDNERKDEIRRAIN